MRLTLKLAILLAVATCGSCAPEATDTVFPLDGGDMGNGMYMNPVLGGDYPDPTVLRVGNAYYMTHSSFNYMPALTVLRSFDLVNWEPVSYALDEYLGSIWAPDIAECDGRYYIYFTVANQDKGEYDNWVVWAESPEGPWSEPIDLHVGQIDPCLVVGDDGQRWLFLSGGYRVKLTDDGLGIVPGTMEHVYDGWPIPEDWITEGTALEGPKVKRVGNYYYLICAQGGTAGPPTSHMAISARSKSLDGPWENDPDNPLIHTYSAQERWRSKGHASIVDTPHGDWWIVYHSYEKGYLNMGRQTLLEPLTITEDGWLKAPSGTLIERPMKKPEGESAVVDRTARLGEFRIGCEWKSYREYDADRFTIADGRLTMEARGDSPHTSVPLLFNPGLHSYEFSVEIDKDTSASAGLLFFYDDDCYMGISFDGHSRYRWRRAQKSRFGECETEHLWLKLAISENVVTGYYSPDGQQWQRETWGVDVEGYNHNNFSEFQSLLPGLFASGEGNVRFSNFKFARLD